MSSVLRADRFYSLQNQVIFEAMLKLYAKNATGDTISLINELTVENKLEQAGGTAYIASLTDTVPIGNFILPLTSTNSLGTALRYPSA